MAVIFETVYQNFGEKMRELSPEAYENYRHGVLDTIKLLGLWDAYESWAYSVGLIDKEN